MDLDSFLNHERLKAFQGKTGAGTDGTTRLPALSPGFLAALEERERESAATPGFDSGLVPINVNYNTEDGSSDPVSSAPVEPVAGPAESFSGGSFTSIPAAASWSGVPSVPLPAASSYQAANPSPLGGDLPTLFYPPVTVRPAASQNPAPRSLPVSVSSGAFLGGSHGGSQFSGVTPTVLTTSAPSQFLAPSLPVSAGTSSGNGRFVSSSINAGATLSTGTAVSSAVVAPGSGSANPLIPMTQNIYVANDNGPGGNGFIGEYNGITSGTPISGFTSPSGLNEPLGVAFGYPTNSTPVLYISDQGTDKVYAVNATTGATFAGFTTITGLTTPAGLAVLGNTLYVANGGAGTIQAYNATTGAQIAFSASGLNSGNYPYGLVVSWIPQDNANILFVADVGTSKLYAFNATSGAAVPFNAPAVREPSDIAIAGNVLYVGDEDGETVNAYSLTNGLTSITAQSGFTTINLGIGDVTGLAVLNGDLYVEDDDRNTVTEWNALTGASIAYTSPTGLDSPDFIVVVPEPASAGLLALGAGALPRPAPAAERVTPGGQEMPMPAVAKFLFLLVMLLPAFLQAVDAEDGKLYKDALVEAIRTSDRIVVTEHSDRSDFPLEEIKRKDLPQFEYGRVELSAPAKAKFLKNAAAMDAATLDIFSACIFVPHHTVAFYAGSTLKSTMRICFECGQIEWDGSTRMSAKGLWSAILPLISDAGFHGKRDWEAILKERRKRRE